MKLILCHLYSRPSRSPHGPSDRENRRESDSGDRITENVREGNVRNAGEATTTRGIGETSTHMREGSNLRNSGRAIGETSRVPVEAVKVICADIDPLIRAERKSDTEVREVVNPAITKETVIKENRETTITAVDRELHQDHYQTRVQPVVDRQILPEEHLHKQAPVEYKEHRHHKGDEIRRALEEEVSLICTGIGYV